MRALVLICCAAYFCGSAQAQEQAPATAPPASVEERLKAMEERIRALEAELQALKAGAATAPAAAAAVVPAAPAPAQVPAPDVAQQAPPVATSQPQTAVALGGAPGAAKLLNPDISVIGNFQGAMGYNAIRPVPGLEFHETEIAFQAFVDPYARADFFLALTPEGIELEEGYLTFTALPGGFVGRVGKFRAAFGKVNTLHNDALSWIDRPLVTENLVAGEEGINDAGFSVSRILPAGNIFLEATGQVFSGEAEGIFTATRRRDVSVVGHLRGYGDISESTNLDLGFSYARGHNELGSNFITNLYGVDATFRWKPLRRAIYNSFLLRSEFIWSHRDDVLTREKAFGYYVSADYRLNRRWTLGGRFDRSGRSMLAGDTDKGFSALLTYWPSEFSQIRGQYRFARYAERYDANELRFQFLFVLGAHGAHPF